jgi:hypothetical protein
VCVESAKLFFLISESHNVNSNSTDFNYDLSRSYKNHDYTNKTLSNAELLAKLSNMGKVSKLKLNKLASRFASKKKPKTSRGSIEFNSIDFNSLDGYSSTGSSLRDEHFDINENSTYDLERMRAEELSMGRNSLSRGSRYKKAYNSIKTVMKRSNPTQSPSGSYSDLNKGPTTFNKNNFY